MLILVRTRVSAILIALEKKRFIQQKCLCATDLLYEVSGLWSSEGARKHSQTSSETPPPAAFLVKWGRVAGR